MGPASRYTTSSAILSVTSEQTKHTSELTLFDAEGYTEQQFVKDAAAIKIARPRNAIDDAREFGGWVIDKLDLLALYFKQYRRVAGGGTYIDGFAGTGRIKVGGTERPGSAAIALSSGAFKRFLFFERPLRSKQLQAFIDSLASERIRSRCSVKGGDFNRDIVPILDSGFIDREKPCFALLDPNSTQLAWTTVEALARYKGGVGGGLKVELWILVNTHQALARLMPKDPGDGYAQSGEALALDRVMGGRSAWWDLFENRRPPVALATRYAERLTSELGYGLARTHLILDRVTKRPQYYMVHASDHKAAFSFMRWAEVQTSQERYETPAML